MYVYMSIVECFGYFTEKILVWIHSITKHDDVIVI